MNIWWTLFIVCFVGASACALKVTVTASGVILHTPAFPWFLYFILGCFIAARQIALTKPVQTAVAEAEFAFRSPAFFLDAILLQMKTIDPEDIELAQIELVQTLCIRMAEERNGYMRQMGLKDFAHFFEPFCHGERYLNRVWSAYVDEHHAEAKRSLSIASQYFQIARESYTEVASSAWIEPIVKESQTPLA